jgi:nicotinamide-nucleotide amidase
MDRMLSDAELNALAERLGQVLKRDGRLLAIAESCTGGWLGRVITSAPGSSAWFERGFVTYSDRAKIEMLGVPPQVLAGYGAVSEPVAVAMTEGALARSHAQIAVAITGVAGPDGGTGDKPVGTVWFAWEIKGQPAQTQRHLLKGDREAIRRQSVAIALDGLYRLES